MPVHSGPPFEGITPWQIPVYSFDKEKAKQEVAAEQLELNLNAPRRRTSLLNDF
tara:strand:- start:818 stop:979 length:162 start_codon:yes stop_codon:yes gene_type:complete